MPPSYCFIPACKENCKWWQQSHLNTIAAEASYPIISKRGNLFHWTKVFKSVQGKAMTHAGLKNWPKKNTGKVRKNGGEKKEVEMVWRWKERERERERERKNQKKRKRKHPTSLCIQLLQKTRPPSKLSHSGIGNNNNNNNSSKSYMFFAPDRKAGFNSLFINVFYICYAIG